MDSFTVEEIRVEGLQRISTGTVFNYLPVKVGDVFDDKLSAESIKALFKTGFFKDVRLDRDGDTLVVVVEERPSIASVTLEGNKDIGSDDLKKGLKSIGLVEGRVFDRQILDKVEQELRRQYYNRGKYGLKIDSEVKQLQRNRVAVTLKISEGKVAHIKQINIVGNHAFTDEELLKVFELGTPHLLSFYTKNDQYSKPKLQADKERLRSYYMDRGYINFEIESTQVSITPNKKDIYITINVKEGEVFKVSDVKLTGKTVVAPEELVSLVKIGPDDTFSQKLATETSKAISDRLGDEGYIFANVNMAPEINAQAKTVGITFVVEPGKQVYVRRINMRGNTKTRDEVLRREMRQMEAAWASTAKIERSKTRLERLGYFQEVNVETPAVPGTNDQIDVNYTVTEKASGNLMAGVGYSQVQGIIFNASVTQDNVFGSGKRINFTFNNSVVSTIYRIGYFNPYSTLDGISSGFDLSYRKTNTSSYQQANISSYNSDVFTGGFNFGLPLSEFSTLRANLDYENTKIKPNKNTSTEIKDFISGEDWYPYRNTSGDPCEVKTTQKKNGEKVDVYSGCFPNKRGLKGYGDQYGTYTVSLGFVHDTLNRALFANKGGMQSISILGAVPFSDLTYYKASARAQHYFPIAKDLTLMLNAEAAYGDGYGSTKQLPFFENYYAGGPLSVRGWMANTLGPKDSFGRTFGGSRKLAGTAELQFPVPFLSEDLGKSVRLGVFFDAGNVFANKYDLGNLRYSAGLSARWLSPFGALIFSVAQPLNSGYECKLNSDCSLKGNQVQDQVQRFQFSFGQGF
ncbi:MAG: outer membrane protein assembly factor BamA [Methylococcaceae bacterium]|nr:outer membrane protein assembly factor BamA [Methylococcaceae bacterium]